MLHSIPEMGIILVASAAIGTPEPELHTFHCLASCPVGAPATNDTIVREIYTLSHNDITRLADWVAYRVTAQTIGSGGSRVWQPDPWLAPDERLTEDSYTGAPRSLRIDRGHQAPLASFSGTPQLADTNILSNITPQASALNQGPWVRLENREREVARTTTVYVLTGPLFERLMRPLPAETGTHRVPSGYWKVVATADGRMTGFIFDQNASRRLNHCDARAPLAEIELRARLILFPRPDTRPSQPLDQALGCTAPAPPRPAPAEIPAE